jgi:hypothetical protein
MLRPSGMRTDTFEHGASHPRKEMKLALIGSVVGALGGAVVFGLLFLIPTLVWEFDYEHLLVIVGTVMGIVHGAGAGYVVALRMSKKLEPRIS